ncbi:helix-turn-helix domain-containing protein [Aquimarina sediminis]|uniref:helix-turn-helix domain-containing protein n=1 Tax=Aquimarina sediminis TaxID=2070536 RepID=UPI000CA06A99|nr:AraC family transcriptional regulator [Aquimarina sediminis]
MNYQEQHTKGYISNFIKSFWKYANTEQDYAYEILPDGFFDLIFEISDEQIRKISLTGVWTRQIKISIPKNTKLIGIRCKLLAAEYIFKRSIKELKNTETQLPRSFLNIEHLQCHNFERFISSISRKIVYDLKNGKEIDQRKFVLFQTLYKLKGEISVRELSEKVCWNSRQINRYFNNQFGFSLKTFCNILKCNATFNQIANGQLFPENEYYDQSHFIKEVKKYTGTTPKGLFQNKNDRFLQLSTLRQE